MSGVPEKKTREGKGLVSKWLLVEALECRLLKTRKER